MAFDTGEVGRLADNFRYVRFFNRAWESSSVYRLVGFVAAWVTLLSVVSS